jgi:hypothetical protein
MSLHVGGVFEFVRIPDEQGQKYSWLLVSLSFVLDPFGGISPITQHQDRREQWLAGTERSGSPVRACNLSASSDNLQPRQQAEDCLARLKFGGNRGQSRRARREPNRTVMMGPRTYVFGPGYGTVAKEGMAFVTNAPHRRTEGLVCRVNWTRIGTNVRKPQGLKATPNLVSLPLDVVGFMTW